MAEHSIPVDLFNPGQVFACLGFLEAAEVLLGMAEGGFDWSDESNVRFCLRADETRNPFESVLEYLADIAVESVAPVGFQLSKEKAKVADEDDEPDEDDAGGSVVIEQSKTYPASSGDVMALPIMLKRKGGPDILVSHWADGSSRNTFKLYSGNRSAEKIARGMLFGARAKPRKNQTVGDLKTLGVAQLWSGRHRELIERPFHVLAPVGGSFNFDPRGSWTAIDAGYSLDKQKQTIASSPVVQMLAAWGLENVRPYEFGTRQVRYSTWSGLLPPMLARVALQEPRPSSTHRVFRFQLVLNGKNKVVTFAQEETAS